MAVPQRILDRLRNGSMYDALKFYAQIEGDADAMREIALVDRFYLAVGILKKTFIIHPWAYARAREVEADPDDHLDLWGRGHFKSELISISGSIQEILKDPEITIGIFSFNRPTAKKFLKSIKWEFEENAELKTLFPDVCYQNPKRESATWSLDDGITVRRKTNQKECTVEAYGLIDAMPTGRHFRLRVYDDVVTEQSVTNPEQTLKATEQWELSQFLGMSGIEDRKWHIGTRYSYSDSYGVMLERGAVKPRLYPATDDGTMYGTPVLLSQSKWDELKRNLTTSTLACQHLQNPLAGSLQTFQPEWVRYWEVRPLHLNVLILVDPASKKRKTSDRTAMAVVGIDAANNKYLLDGLCHRMSLSERWDALKKLRAKWVQQPGVQQVWVGYEQFGMQSDMEHFESEMDRSGVYFQINELAWPREGPGAKEARIQRLEPDFRNWAFFLPYGGFARAHEAVGRDQWPTEITPELRNAKAVTKRMRAAVEKGQGYLCAKDIRKADENGKPYDLVEYMVLREFALHPASAHDDFLDALSRVYDAEIGKLHIGEQTAEPEDEGVY